MKDLTGLQLAWADAYLIHFDKTQAAKDAGYKASSDGAFASIGWENWQKEHIREYISVRLKERAMSVDENLMHLGEIARGSIRPSFFFKREMTWETDEDGNIIEASQATGNLDWDKLDKYGHLVKSISFTANGPRLELHDRLKALQIIAQHHGLLDPKSLPPQENINYTVDEWKAEQAKRTKEAEETARMFDELDEAS